MRTESWKFKISATNSRKSDPFPQGARRQSTTKALGAEKNFPEVAQWFFGEVTIFNANGVAFMIFCQCQKKYIIHTIH